MFVLKPLTHCINFVPGEMGHWEPIIWSNGKASTLIINVWAPLSPVNWGLFARQVGYLLCKENDPQSLVYVVKLYFAKNTRSCDRKIKKTLFAHLAWLKSTELRLIHQALGKFSCKVQLSFQSEAYLMCVLKLVRETWTICVERVYRHIQHLLCYTVLYYRFQCGGQHPCSIDPTIHIGQMPLLFDQGKQGMEERRWR